MNIKLHHVISDLMGVTGQAIVRAIVAGERDAQVLARLRTHTSAPMRRRSRVPSKALGAPNTCFRSSRPSHSTMPMPAKLPNAMRSCSACSALSRPMRRRRSWRVAREAVRRRTPRALMRARRCSRPVAVGSDAYPRDRGQLGTEDHQRDWYRLKSFSPASNTSLPGWVCVQAPRSRVAKASRERPSDAPTVPRRPFACAPNL